MHVCALGDLAARRVQRYPSFLLGRIALAQLLTLAVDDADVTDPEREIFVALGRCGSGCRRQVSSSYRRGVEQLGSSLGS